MAIKKQNPICEKHCCRECAYATDFHEKNWKGEYFMCKCQFHKWSKFLNHSCCEHFKLK